MSPRSLFTRKSGFGVSCSICSKRGFWRLKRFGERNGRYAITIAIKPNLSRDDCHVAEADDDHEGIQHCPQEGARTAGAPVLKKAAKATKKPQYSRSEGRRLIRKDFLFSRELDERLEKWRDREGLPAVDLVRKAIARELDLEKIPRVDPDRNA
jgi:hypothetical protein